MASLRFGSFGAATMPLSKIVVDKDLDMRPYAIKAQYRPEEWATETLEWGDTAETVETLTNRHHTKSPKPIFSTVSGPAPTKWVLNLKAIRTDPNHTYPMIQVLADGVEILNTGQLSLGFHELVFYPPAGVSIVVNHLSYDSGYFSGIEAGATLKNTGIVVGPKTFDLSGKWLALGLDMKGLAATVKVQGVEIPYSDYAKYFPLAPTELKIPGNWSPSQERPVIEVYK